MVYEAVVLGAGPAGLLIAELIARTGTRVLCIDGASGRPPPQGAHVHQFPCSTWTRLSAVWPELHESLAEQGSLFRDQENRNCPAHRVGAIPSPDRSIIDTAVSRLLHRRVEQRPGRARFAVWRDGAWSIDVLGETSIRTRWLVDATGRARKSLGWVAEHRGCPVAVDEGPATGIYWSAEFETRGLAPGMATLRQRAGKGAGLLALRLGPGHWRLTLAEQGSGHPPNGDDLLASLTGSLQARIANARRLTPWIRSGAQPASLVALDEVDDVPGWLLVGDGLLTTAPYQGNGFSQLLDQADALTHGLEVGEDAPALRRRVFRAARPAWFRATFKDLLASAS